MQIAELIKQAADRIEQESSPWAPELLTQLRHLEHVAHRHEEWSHVGNTSPPIERKVIVSNRS